MHPVEANTVPTTDIERFHMVSSDRPELPLITVKFLDSFATRLDRGARGMGDLLEIAEQLRGKGVALQVLDPAMDTSTAAGELIFRVFGAVASFERKLMLERQREGIAKARTEGRYTGRKPTVRDQAETIRAMMTAGDGPTVIARKLKVARSSVYAALKASPSSISEPIVTPG
jgi:DNA invertase Pin-like site-specific DNA recombinase